ncbi:transcriptional regulator RaaS [soil metagenome]
MTSVPTSTSPSTDRSAPVDVNRDRLCDMAIEHFGRFGFDETMLEMSIATDVEVATLSEFFGSIERMRAACDRRVLDTVKAAKTDVLTSHDAASWLVQVAQIDSFAPLMMYIVRCLETRDDNARSFMVQMTDNAEAYLEEAVHAGTLKPSRDPKARARFLAMSSGGSFLLYRQLHRSPSDMQEVLRDYARDMIMPALELYTQGLLVDDSFYAAFGEKA